MANRRVREMLPFISTFQVIDEYIQRRRAEMMTTENEHHHKIVHAMPHRMHHMTINLQIKTTNLLEL